MAYDPEKVAFLVLEQEGKYARFTVPSVGRSPLLVFTSPFTAKRFFNKHGAGKANAVEVLARDVEAIVESVIAQGISEVLIDLESPEFEGKTHPPQVLYRYRGIE